jgi:hypothetical protein
MATKREERAAAARLAGDQAKARKLHVIAERRAGREKMTKQDYIAGIVAGRFAPISASDLANEPDPQ